MDGHRNLKLTIISYVCYLITCIQNHSQASYCTTELSLMLLRDESGRRSSLFDCKYMEGMWLDRRHVVLTQSRQPPAPFTHQEDTISSCYTVHMDNVHIFTVIVSLQLQSFGRISTQFRTNVWCIIIIISSSSSSSSSSVSNGGCIVLLHSCGCNSISI